jgi:hypothetical protein
LRKGPLGPICICRDIFGEGGEKPDVSPND